MFIARNIDMLVGISSNYLEISKNNYYSCYHLDLMYK